MHYKYTFNKLTDKIGNLGSKKYMFLRDTYFFIEFIKYAPT